MHRFAPVALATLLAATASAPFCAQTPTPFTPPSSTAHFTDPANLAGERVRPRDGRELPIDGGQGNNALGLAQMLRRLNTRASLMLIVAHPDDEDGGMLAYYSRGLGARVAILTLNRGEGGQNQMTGDFEDALGLLRTQELLSADRYMGVDQFFGTEVDFGFTKTKEEAFQKWNHERVLYDAVRAVRIYRPLVIASVFMGAVTDGHGQHQVSGEIAQEVFKAAGDPNVFPELTREGILPWQPLKVYARVPFSRVSAQGLYDSATGQTVPAQFTNYVTGQTFSTEPTADVTVHEGNTDPLLTYNSANAADLRSKPSNLNEQLSYVQFARIGLGLQRSQIGAGMRIPPAGRVDVGYHLYGSRVCAPNLPNPTPQLCTSPSTTAMSSHETGWPTLSQSERVGYRAPREKTSSAHLAPTSFTSTASDNPELANQPSFFDGIDTTLDGIASLAPSAKGDIALVIKTNLAAIKHSIVEAQLDFKPDHPDLAANRLSEALALTDKALKNIEGFSPSQLANNEKETVLHELRIKRVQLNDALVLALEVGLDATVPTSVMTVPVEDSLWAIHAKFTAPRQAACTLKKAFLRGSQGEDSSSAYIQDDDAALTNAPTLRSILPPSETIVFPYFRRPDVRDPVYTQLRIPALRNAPQTPPALTAWGYVRCGTSDMQIGSIVRAGDQPLRFVPRVSITVTHAQPAPLSEHTARVDVSVTPADVRPEVSLRTALRWNSAQAASGVPGLHPFVVDVPQNSKGQIAVGAEAKMPDGKVFYDGFRSVGYGDLPMTTYFTVALDRVVPVDLKLPPENKHRIAYLPGTGDDVPAALASIGLAPTMLKVSDLTPDNLSHFDTVILGVRTYNAHPDLHGAPTQALLDFARNGGNVVVQYQTPEFTAADAPYPLTDRNERVIDETAPVKLLDPTSLLLTTPNKITEADFNGWNEERGHGFLDTWDSHYTTLTETADPGAPAEHIQPQDPQRGGLITTQLGKGRWTYVAFALYRQLPEAVPGAFRLFVNLLNP